MKQNDVSCKNEFNNPACDERVIIDLDKLLAALDYEETTTKKDQDVKPRSI